MCTCQLCVDGKKKETLQPYPEVFPALPCDCRDILHCSSATSFCTVTAEARSRAAEQRPLLLSASSHPSEQETGHTPLLRAGMSSGTSLIQVVEGE